MAHVQGSSEDKFCIINNCDLTFEKQGSNISILMEPEPAIYTFDYDACTCILLETWL